MDGRHASDSSLLYYEVVSNIRTCIHVSIYNRGKALGYLNATARRSRNAELDAEQSTMCADLRPQALAGLAGALSIPLVLKVCDGAIDFEVHHRFLRILYMLQRRVCWSVAQVDERRGW